MRKFKFISILLLINISLISAEDLKAKREQLINNTFNQIVGSLEKEYYSAKQTLTKQRQKIEDKRNKCNRLGWALKTMCKKALDIAISLGDKLGEAFNKAEEQYNKAKSKFDDALKLINQFFDYLEATYGLTKTLGDLLKSLPSAPQFRSKTSVKWIMPNKSLRYNEVCFFGSHNSFSSFAEGYFPYLQQYWSVEDQLTNGVRAFDDDIYLTQKDTNEEFTRDRQQATQVLQEAVIRLCHGKPWQVGVLFRTKKALEYYTNFIKNLPEKIFSVFNAGGMKDVINQLVNFQAITTPKIEEHLDIFYNFLQKNPREIITILFEPYMDNDIIDKDLDTHKIKKFILKPSDWDVLKNQGWPTLEWMIKNNKRLVITHSNKEKGRGHDEISFNSKYLWGDVLSIVRGNYGTLDIKETARQTGGSDKYFYPLRYLYKMDYFVEMPVNFGKLAVQNFLDLPKKLDEFLKETKDLNDYYVINSRNLQELLNYEFEYGLGPKGSRERLFKNRYPNFIAIDFVNIGNTALKIINQINAESLRNKDRENTIFRPLSNTKENLFAGLDGYKGAILIFNQKSGNVSIEYKSGLRPLQAVIAEGKKPLNPLGIRYDETKREYSYLTKIINFKGLGEYKNKTLTYDPSKEKNVSIKGSKEDAFEGEIILDQKPKGAIGETKENHTNVYLIQIHKCKGLGKYKGKTLIYYPVTYELREENKEKETRLLTEKEIEKEFLPFEAEVIKGNPPSNALAELNLNNEKYYLTKVFVYTGLEDYKDKKIIYNPETKKAYIEGQKTFDADVIKDTKPSIAIGKKTIEKKNYYLINLFEGIGDFKDKLLAYTPKSKNASTWKTKQKLIFKLDLVTSEKTNKKDVYAEYTPKAPIGKTILEDGNTYYLVNLEKEYPNKVIFEKSSKEYPDKILIFDPKAKKAFTEYNDENTFSAQIKKVVSRIGGGRPPREFLTTKVDEKTREVSYLVKR